MSFSFPIESFKFLFDHYLKIIHHYLMSFVVFLPLLSSTKVLFSNLDRIIRSIMLYFD